MLYHVPKIICSIVGINELTNILRYVNEQIRVFNASKTKYRIKFMQQKRVKRMQRSNYMHLQGLGRSEEFVAGHDDNAMYR